MKINNKNIWFSPLFVLAAALALPAPSVQAKMPAQAAPAAPVMSLRQAVAVALRENPRIKARQWAVKGSEEAVGVSKGYLYPSVSFESSYLRTNNPVYAFMSKLNERRFSASDFAISSLDHPSAVGDFQNSFRLDQVIYSRRLWAGLGMSKAERAAQSLDFDRLRQKVAMDTVSAYLGVVTAKNSLDAAKKAVRDRSEHEKLAKERYQAGLGLYSDVLRADAALKDAQRGLAQAQSGYAVARRALGLVMGRTGSVAAAPTAYKIVLGSIGSYYATVPERPDIEAIETRVKKAKDAVAVAGSGYFPEIGATAEYQWNDNRDPVEGEANSYQAGVSLKWDIFDGTRREHAVSQARAGLNEVREGLEGAKKQARFEVFRAYEDVREARKALDFAGAELASAREGRRLIELRYKNSLAPIVDLLDSEVMVESARRQVIMARNSLMEKYFTLGFESGGISRFINEVSSYGQAPAAAAVKTKTK